MFNSFEVLFGFVGKESIIFGNIEDIYNFYNRFVFFYMIRLFCFIVIFIDEN